MRVAKVTIEEWVKALRSGEFKQGKGALQTPGGFCCLGVACKVFIPEGKQRLVITGDRCDMLYGGLPTLYQPFAPNWLQNIAEDFSYRTNRDLTVLNDGVVGKDSYTFDEIADLLEAVYVLKVLE